jgi:hypothetical protein
MRSRFITYSEYLAEKSSLNGDFRKLHSEIDAEIYRLLVEKTETKGWFSKEAEESVEEKAAGGELNELDIITYKFGISETETKGKFEKVEGEKLVGYFKVGAEETKGSMGIKKGIPEMYPAEHMRTLAMYELDKALGSDVLPPVFLAKHGGKIGTVMAKVMGKAGGKSGKALKQPDVQRSLSKLYLLDIIAGQVDRHSGNYILEVKGGVIKGVRGIDLDLAFGEKYTGADVEDYNQTIAEGNRLQGSSDKDEQEEGRKMIREVRNATRGKMPVELEEIDQSFAKRIIEIAETGQQKIRDALGGLLPEAEINATIDRLKSLAKVLKPLIGKEDKDMVITESKKS